jgi:hypothetical protein
MMPWCWMRRTWLDEYLTELMDSDTMLTLENTDDAMKSADKFMQRSDKEAHDVDQNDKRVAFSPGIEELEDDSTHIVALRAELKAKDERLAALEAKIDQFSPPPDPRDPTGKKRRRDGKPGQASPPCAYCKKTGHNESTCWVKQKDELEAKITKAEAAREARKPSAAETKAFKGLGSPSAASRAVLSLSLSLSLAPSLPPFSLSRARFLPYISTYAYICRARVSSKAVSRLPDTGTWR